MNLTTHIILRSQTDLLEETLRSLLPLHSTVLAADVGASRAALSVCKSYNLEVKKYPWKKSFSEVRNRMADDSKTDWNLFLEPWEALMDGHEAIVEATQGEPIARRLTILAGESLRKEVRLWHKGAGCQFTNPVFEGLECPANAYCHAVIWENKIERPEVKELLEVWEKTEPFCQDMRYFKALDFLAAGNHQGFVRMAKQYLFHQKAQPVACAMIRYYLGLVNCMMENDYAEASKNAILCLAANPLMAEYWCLLGDTFFRGGDLARAEHFYQNARVLGSRRLNDDAWPMHIPKYEEYPAAMIQRCQMLRGNVKRSS